MTDADIEDNARRFIQTWNAGQRRVVDERAAPGLTVEYMHYPEPYHGPEAFKNLLARTHRFFPDLSIEVHNMDVRLSEAWAPKGTRLG